MNDLPQPDANIVGKHRAPEWGLAAVVSCCVALAVVSPFFFLGTASGHDIAFHMASWLDAAGQWKQGILFPRWAEWPNYGFGEPRFIFYPPLSWLLGAFLGTLIPWKAVAAVFIVCVQTFAGLSAYVLLGRLNGGSRWAPLFGAACFAANPYALVIIYSRSDFAELLAVAIFPLLFLAALRLCESTQHGESRRFPGAVAFALSFCAIWLSNAPAAVIATYSAAFLFILKSLEVRSARPTLRGASALLLGFGFSGFYLVPAIYEQRWVNIAGALAGGLTPADNFLYARTTDAEHDAFNRVASNIAVLLLVWAAAAALAAWRQTRQAQARAETRNALALASLTAVATLLMLPLTSALWRFLPELRFVQFPWRWMSVVALCAIVFMSATAQGKGKWVWLLLSALSMVGSGRYLVKHTWWDTEDMPTLEAALEDRTGFVGTDEYDPLDDDHTDLPQKAPRAGFLPRSLEGDTPAAQKIVIDRWTAEHRSLRVSTPTGSHIAVRLLDYPAWHIEVNGHQVAAQHVEGTQQIVIPVASGESKIEIQFQRTLDRKIGGWTSLLSVLASIAVVFWQKRARKVTATDA
jgi:6-pyruvoyl-tetrahydropterin synthase related domain